MVAFFFVATAFGIFESCRVIGLAKVVSKSYSHVVVLSVSRVVVDGPAAIYSTLSASVTKNVTENAFRALYCASGHATPFPSETICYRALPRQSMLSVSHNNSTPYVPTIMPMKVFPAKRRQYQEEVQAAQQHLGCFFAKKRFERLAREIANDSNTGLRWTREAVDVLQIAAEDYITNWFKCLVPISVNAKRRTLMIQDADTLNAVAYVMRRDGALARNVGRAIDTSGFHWNPDRAARKRERLQKEAKEAKERKAAERARQRQESSSLSSHPSLSDIDPDE